MSDSKTLKEFTLKDRIFLDANIFLFHALDHEQFGEESTKFLGKIETGEIKGIITSLVVDEVLFKILVASASMFIEKPSIWNIRRKLKEKKFKEEVYQPVEEYKDYIWSLTQNGLEIIGLEEKMAFESVALGRQYGLLTSDAMHLAAMKVADIAHIATNDSDFLVVDFITVWNLKETDA